MAGPPDWRSEEIVRELSRLERHGFAWEFLRRNPEYRDDYARQSGVVEKGSSLGRQTHRSSTAAKWGLHFPARSRSPGQHRSDLLAPRSSSDGPSA
jgi:hypothetical protein